MTTNTRLIQLAMVLLAGFLAPASGAEILTVQRAAATPPGQVYRMLEWVVDPGRAYAHPLDPGQIAIDGTFTGPRGATITIPAFWADTFATPPFATPTTPLPVRTGGHWLLRFTPTSAGRWTLAVTAHDARDTRTAGADSFVVAPGAGPGFVRRAGRYLQFDTGGAYFPVGLNMAWGTRGGNVEQYEHWFATFAAAGGNFVRVWQCPPARRMVGPGGAEFDLAVLDYYDAVLDAARKHGIGVMLTLNNFRELHSDGWLTWQENPYNAAHGGPATQAADFFTSAAVQQLYQRRLRYLVARYGAYTSLAAWELWNEQEFIHEEVPMAWMQQAAGYLQQHDPYRHLVSSSSVLPEEMWRLEALSLTQSHIYGDSVEDMISPVVAAARGHQRFGKPHLVAEFGLDADFSDARLDAAGMVLHQGLWAAMCSGAAGTTCHWYWDDHVDKNNLWSAYTGVAKFAGAVDWPRRDFAPLDLLPETPGGPATWSAVTLEAGGDGDYPPWEPTRVLANGQMIGGLPHYLYHESGKNQRHAVLLDVNLPAPGVLGVRCKRVDDYALLRVRVDDQPVADLLYSVLPGAADITTSHGKPNDKEHGILRYTSDLAGVRQVPLPAGHHQIKLENMAGAWVILEALTLSNARSARYGHLGAVALQDQKTQETMAWIYDQDWTWKTAAHATGPRTITGATVTIPLPGANPASVQWWDTSSGAVLQQQTRTPVAGKLSLTVPDFTRDVALRVFR